MPHGLLSLLDDEQARLVRQPSLHPELHGARYPLGVGQVARLAGVTERQVRHWSDLRLLRSERDSGERRFWPAGVAAALVLSDASQHSKAVAAEIARGEGIRVLALVAEALLVWAENLDADQATRAERAARALVEMAEPAASLPDASSQDDSRPDLMSAPRASLDAPRGREAACRQELSARDREMLAAIGDGITAREMAERLGLSERDTRRFAQTALRKLGLASDGDAAEVEPAYPRHTPAR